MIDESRTVVTHNWELGMLRDRLVEMGDTPRNAKRRVQGVQEDRGSVAVTIEDSANPFGLTLYFEDAERNAPFVRFTVEAEQHAELDPKAFARLARNMPSYLAYARAQIAWDHNDARAAAEEHRRAGTSPKGYPDSFYRGIASEYRRFKASGDPHPVKTLAESQPVHRVTASTWLSEARKRGFLEGDE